MAYVDFGPGSHFGQDGQSDGYDADPPQPQIPLADYPDPEYFDGAEEYIELRAGEWVSRHKPKLPSPSVPQREDGNEGLGAPTYRAPHGRNTSTPAEDSSVRYQTHCGIDWLTLFIFITDVAKPDATNKYCPDGAVATFDRLLEWADANAVKPQSSPAEVWGGSGRAKRVNYHIYGRHVATPLEFKCEGITISIADPRLHTDNSKPIGQVIVGGRRLSRTGHLDVLRQVGTLLRGLGLRGAVMTEERIGESGKIRIAKYADPVLRVQRIDVRADVLNCPVREFLALAHSQTNNVSRFKKTELRCWGERDSPETVAFGKSNRVRLQLYDKIHGLQDLVQRGQEIEANDTWVNLCGRYDEVPSSIMRAEFQIGKEWLQEHYGVCDVATVLRKLDHIVEYLFTEQFRVLDRPVDRESRNHTLKRGTYDLHPVWASIIEATRESDFGDDVLSCQVAERVAKAKRQKSKECAERDLCSIVTRAMALSMTPEEIDQTCETAEGVANFVARFAVAASTGNRERIRNKAILLQQRWHADDVLPYAAREAWSHREVPGYEVTVYAKFLDGHTSVGAGVPF